MSTQVPESPSKPAKQKLSVIRWFFAIIGFLIMSLGAVCLVLMGYIMVMDIKGWHLIVGGESITLLGVIPFLFGLIVWRLAVQMVPQ